MSAELTCRYSEDAVAARGEAAEFLLSDPVNHNMAMTLLAERVANSATIDGRYWWVLDRDEVLGFAVQSPFDRVALVLAPSRVPALALVSNAPVDISLPGVLGELSSAAAFAKAWAEKRGVDARPKGRQRIYEATEVIDPPSPAGESRTKVIPTCCLHGWPNPLLRWAKAAVLKDQEFSLVSGHKK